LVKISYKNNTLLFLIKKNGGEIFEQSILTYHTWEGGW
jgi:hypothetical protein